MDADALWDIEQSKQLEARDFRLLDITPAGHGAMRLRGHGHDDETYRNDGDGTWRISSKRNVRLRVDQ